MAVNRDILAAMAIRIGVDSASFSKSLGKVQDDMNLFKSSIVGLGKVMVATFSAAAIEEFVRTSVMAYAEQEKAVVKLNTALRGNEKQLNQLVTLASILQGKTVFGDETTIDAMARMRALMGDNVEAIKKLIPLVQDMATVKEMQLAEAADLVAKSISSGTNALSRYGITIKGAIGSSERIQSAVDGLTKAFQGQAEAAGKTLTGSITQLTNAWGDLKEVVGGTIAPAMIETVNKWKEWVVLRSQPDLSVWDKWVIDLSNAGRHRLYEELQMKLLKESSEDVQAAWEKISKSYDNILSKQGPQPLLSKSDQAAIASKLNPQESTAPLVAQIPLLEAAKNKLKEYKDAFEASLTEQELTKWGRLVEIQSKEVQRLEDMGKAIKYLSSEEIKQSLADMAASVGGIVDTGFTPSSIQGRVGPIVDNGKGGQTVGANTTTLNFPEQKRKWEENYNAFKMSLEKMRSLVEQETAIINETFSGIAVGFGEALGQMVAIGGGFNWGMIVSPIADAMSSLGKLIITASLAIGTLKKTLVQWATANPVLGVIAGTALIAAAAAIKAGVSNSINGIASGGSGSMAVSSGGTTTETFHRNLGDLQPIRVEVTGTISGDVIRLANKRATDKHINGY